MSSAFLANTSFKQVSLDDKYALDKTRAYMTGIEALVRLPMLQHQRDLQRGLNTAGFISGYRGSPLGSLDQSLKRAKKYLDHHHIHFQPAINEDLAATAVWGSQQVNLFEGAKYDGVFSMWYGKGPGVDRSMDAIRHANACGTSKYGGVLAVAGDDHASKSSTLPHQSEHLFIAAQIPVLNPANVQEVLDLGVYGWELSRYCGSWVALKAITENMDSAISADIDPGRVSINLPKDFKLPVDGVHIRWPDQPLEQELRLNKYRTYAAIAFAKANNLNRIVIDSPQARLGIITTGKAYLDVLQALEDLGINPDKAASIGLRVYKVGMSWPLEPDTTHRFASGLEEILVVEEKRSIIEDQLTGQLYNWPVRRRPRVIGEFDEHGHELLSNLSELTPAMVARAIAGRIQKFYQDSAIAERLAFYDHKEQALAKPRHIAKRSPHYCSGCPHSQSTKIPEGSRALGGIGCHYMGTWMPGNRAAHTFTQMGGEGITWLGQSPFTHTKHVFQNIGDGTYFHSGLLAIRQAIAANLNITYKILYNDAVAMTGGQAIDGDLSVSKMIAQLRAEGAERIALLSDYPEKYNANDPEFKIPAFKGLSIDHRRRLIAIEKELRELPGTTIIIFEQICAAEKRRRQKHGELSQPVRRVIINRDLCEACGDCSTQSNCLSVIPVKTELGDKRHIDQNSCNTDYSCVEGFCPSFVSVIGGLQRRPSASQLEELDAQFGEPLPEPELAPITQRPWNIVVAGVGGTGVLTVNSLIAMAAHIEGKGCSTMNQTGLAQKFGAVVSHVRVGINQDSINAVRIPAGDADLLLGCDLVVAASDEPLAKVNSERSFAIINDMQLPTADFINQKDYQLPSAAMKQSIEAEVGASKVFFINSSEITTSLLGESLGSNLFLLGLAYQQGKLPVSADALEKAINLNGVAITHNLRAFKWGRRAAINLNKVKQLAGIKPVFKALSKLEHIIEDRSQRLEKYQNTRYAQLYLDQIKRVHMAEKDLSAASTDNSLAKAVAWSLYKLMAYRDEYEVARLLTSTEFRQQIRQQFSGNYHLRYHLAAPFIAKQDAESGLPIKRNFPGISRILFTVLAHFKFLRGTVFDVFSYGQDRRTEQQLLRHYRALIREVLAGLNQDNYATAIELLSLPQATRGFGHIKLASIDQYHHKLAPLLSKFHDRNIHSRQIH